MVVSELKIFGQAARTLRAIFFGVQAGENLVLNLFGHGYFLEKLAKQK